MTRRFSWHSLSYMFAIHSCIPSAVPVLKLFYQRMKFQPAAEDGRSSTKVVLSENEKIQPATGEGRCTTRE